MSMPLDTLKTLQDLEITGAGATDAPTGVQQQQPEDENNTQLYEQQPIEIGGHGHGQQQHHHSAQTIHHHPSHPTTAPHSAADALQAHPPEQPHSTPFYPPLLSHHFAFDHPDGTAPIDPGLLDARFDHSAASGHGGGGVPGFHQGHHQWAAAPQPVSSANMDSFMWSPITTTALPQFCNTPLAPFQPGISGFEPMISTTWSMDGSLPSTSTSSKGLTMTSSMSVPSTSTPASSKSPGSPGKVGAAMNSQLPTAGRDLTSSPGVQLEQPRAEDQPNKKRRQTIVPEATTKTSAEKLRSNRNNSSPGFSTPQVPIAPAPVAMAGTGDDNKKNIDKKKGGSSSSSGSKDHDRNKKTTTTSNSVPSRPSEPGPSTTTATTTVLPGQAPDPRARNREAANRCRAKSKVAVGELEATERAMGSEHQALTQTARHLRDEVLALKNELLMHGNCDDDLIQRYLANSARMVGSGANVLGGNASVVTTTTTAGGLPGLSLQPPPPSLGGGGGRRAILSSVSPPRVLPTILPSSSSSGPGGGTTTTTTTTTTARGRGSLGGRKP